MKECISPYINDIKGILDLDNFFESYQLTDKNIKSQLEVEDNTGLNLTIETIKIDIITTEGFARVPVALVKEYWKYLLRMKIL